jgi:hypothetical protein
MFARGASQANLAAAVALFESCLDVYSFEEFPMQWAECRNNLATCFSETNQGDRSHSLVGGGHCCGCGGCGCCI